MVINIIFLYWHKKINWATDEFMEDDISIVTIIKNCDT